MKIYLSLLLWLGFNLIHGQNQGVSISPNGSVPDPSAMLDIQSTTGGVLFPRMTEAQRNAIVAPQEGLFVFNTTSRCFEVFNQNLSIWQRLYCICDAPPAPVVSAATNINYQGFTANWQASPGATGYFIDLAYDTAFNFIIPGYLNYFAGAGTSVTVTGVLCDTTVYYRVRAFTGCGSGMSAGRIAATTGACVACIRYGTSNYEEIRGFVSNSDGSVLTATYMEQAMTNGSYGFNFSKISANNQLVWTQSVGFNSGDAYLTDACAAHGGGIVAVGYAYTNTYNSSSRGRIMAVHVDDNGNVVWAYGYGGTTTTIDDIANQIAPTPDGGYVIGGYTRHFGASTNGFYALKISGTGAVQWGQLFSSSNQEYGQGVAAAPDGSVYVTGYRASSTYGSNDFMIVKFSSTGSFQWARVQGGSNSDVGLGAAADAQNNVYTVGYTNSFGNGNQAIYLTKTDPSGALLWANRYETSNSLYAQKVVWSAANGGELLVIGEGSVGVLGSDDILILKINPADGAVIQTVVGGSSSSDGGRAIVPVQGGSGYLAGGYTGFLTYGSNDGYIMKLDANLNGCCTANATVTTVAAGNSTSVSGSIFSGGTQFSGHVTNTRGQMQVVCP
jgi:hypothetical protein